MNEAIASSVWVTSPEFAGWLTKRGFAWRKLWCKKWIALHGAEIVYMEQEPTLQNSGIKMTKGQLTFASKIDPDDLEGNPLGFAIHLNDGKSPVWYLRAGTVREKKDWLVRLSHIMAIILWLENFEKVRVLGLGGTGIVYELLHKSDGRRYALKEIEIKNKAQMTVALQEAEMLKEIMENISHPNIMHIEKVFQVGSKFYLVFPLCAGGELYEHVVRRGRFTERDAAALTRTLMSGIHALHSREILHLDIKPENILFESTREDSPIKLTDFGLSKFFADLNTTETLIPTVEELDRRLKDFCDNGVLNTMKLKGTVGYMSPELILTGHTSKCTDIFAAGVVIYILLCGHPPFHSKSNREVLEKTCRGTFKMEGSGWRDVSDEAKDLVRGMLQRDPRKRLTVAEVIAHAWLRPDDVGEGQAEGEGEGKWEAARSQEGDEDDGPMPSRSSASMGRRSSARLQNLAGLHRLSKHVIERRSEKFISGLTNLVAFIEAGAGSGSKLIQFVRLASSGNSVVPGDGANAKANVAQDLQGNEEEVIFLNPYVRAALHGAISRGCDDGKMTIEQFLSVLKKLGIASGLPGAFLCRFVDRDGDGYISADDIFTTQALVMQRSEVFLRIVFRVYSESIWYPGRQLNLVRYYQQQQQQQSTPKKGPSSSSISTGTKVLDEAPAVDVIEPPKFITPRHVAEVFSKLGYNAEDGKAVFGALCENLAGLALQERSPSREGDHGEEETWQPGNPRGAKLDGLSGLGSDRCSERSALSHVVTIPASPDSGGTNHAGEESVKLQLDSPMGVAGGEEGSGVAGDSPMRFTAVGADTPQSGAQSVATTPVRASTALNAASLTKSALGGACRMDVDEFMRCVEFDDVLVQALLRRPRSGFLHLVERAKAVDELRGLRAPGTREADNPTSALEEELVAALLVAKHENLPSVPFPVASALAIGTVNVLQKMVSGIVGSFEATSSINGDET